MVKIMISKNSLLQKGYLIFILLSFFVCFYDEIIPMMTVIGILLFKSMWALGVVKYQILF